MNHPLDRGVRACAQAIATREASSAELVAEAIARAERAADLNAFITLAGVEPHATPAGPTHDNDVDPDRRAARRGFPSILAGIPFAHKDIFCTNGIRTTCGSRMLADFVPPYDATVVARLAAAGAVSIGKTNLDEFAMGSSNENSAFGPVRNPWYRARVPGGSSGGSAAAVAAGIVPFATGSDTGGSVRQPAAFCGLTGLKPTYGRVSRYGLVAYASSLDTPGVIARSADDCAHVLQAIAGADARDATCATSPVEDYVGALDAASLAGVRIGIAREYFGAGVDRAVADATHAALREFERFGATLVDVSLPHAGLAIAAYYVIAPAEASSNLARYDGVRYGHRARDARSLDALYTRTRAEGFGAEVKRRILIGTFALSAGYYDAYYLRAQRVRQRIADDFATAFRAVDFVAGPTAPTTAFALGEKSADPLAMYAADVNTIAANLAGLPAISLPSGFVDGLPVGLQLIAPAFAEARLLAAAHRFQQATDWHARRPGAPP